MSEVDVPFVYERRGARVEDAVATRTTLTSERDLKLSSRIFDAARVAAEHPKSVTSLVAEIWHQLDPDDGFSFTFLNTVSFFGDPSRARDILLTVIERCMNGTRGEGVAHFDVGGRRGVITLDYETRVLVVTLDGVSERWTRRLTKEMAHATRVS